MTDRAGEFRKHAERCVALARVVTDPVARSALLLMAQRWYDLANEPVPDLNTVLEGFNEQQLTKPVAQQQPQQQQQQQIQSSEKDENE